ncbi:MAG: DUF2914 domain-containing protein [bacterium]|nr:DUF2914 domain-containing protein [bacterium]
MNTNRFSFKNLKDFFHKHESALSSGTLITGFLIDYFTLRRVDYLFDNILIVFYLLLAGASIFLINLYETGKFRNKFTVVLYEFLPLILQFTFGGLFSAFTIFYGKSASFVATGFFVLSLFAIMIGNEFFKKRYSKLVFQVGIYFLALFSFFIYFLPVILRQMGVVIFLWSGTASLIFISIFIFFIARVAHFQYKDNYRTLFLAIFGVWAAMNLLYFFNVIPPIPLSLKTGAVYHSVQKLPGGGYLVVGEAETEWYKKWSFKKEIHLRAGEGVYVWSSVFAPAGLNINITHAWQYFDEEKGEWVDSSRISFPVLGGRDGGYRGFSKKENIFPGAWRVDVKTERGQIIGRVRFDIKIGDFAPELQIKQI